MLWAFQHCMRKEAQDGGLREDSSKMEALSFRQQHYCVRTELLALASISMITMRGSFYIGYL
jgi:hypothetical protein